MKILPLATISYNYSNLNSVKKEKNVTPTFSKSLRTDTVTFSAKRQKIIKDLRLIPDITCACCGEKTIPKPEIDKFMNTQIYYTGKKALTILKKAGYFNPSKMTVDESEAYTFCKLCTSLYGNETLQEILDKNDIKNLMKVLTPEERKHIFNIEKMTRQLTKDSSFLIKKLEIYESRMRPTEKEVFGILKSEVKKRPQKTFTEILSDIHIKDNHLKDLETQQNTVFANIITIAAKMSPNSFNKVLDNVNQSKKIFDTTQTENSNKRTRIIDSFEKLTSELPEKKLANKILEEINKLPSSRNNASSFIIKYENMNSNTIVEQLLRGSTATHEHVKPRRRENDNGPDSNENYIVLCSNCNSERQRIPYSKFIKSHPQMPMNLQKYLDIVIKNINNGLLFGFDKYPWDIKKAIEVESNGEIKLDIKSLDLLSRNQQKKIK